MGTAEQAIDSRAFSDFCGVTSPDQVPDGDTIGRFRNILIEHGVQQTLFDQVLDLLSERGKMLKKGTIVTPYYRPPRHNEQEKKRDGTRISRKGKHGISGIKAHIGSIDGLVHLSK
jgi:IS5 family transposase